MNRRGVRDGGRYLALALVVAVAGAAVIWKPWLRSEQVAPKVAQLAPPPPTPVAAPPAPPPGIVQAPVVTAPVEPVAESGKKGRVTSPVRTERAPHHHPKPTVASKPEHERADSAYLTVNSVPWGAVVVDGKRVGDETPVYKLPLAPGSHRVQVLFLDQSQGASVQDVVLAPGEMRSIGFKR